MPFRLLEQNGRAAGAQHAITNLGHFQPGIDFDADALQLAELFELGDEIAQVLVLHSSGLRLSSPTMPANTAPPSQLLCRKALKQAMRSRPRISVQW